ncbi:hypothetical protein ACGF5F_16215 [Streptomyces sp. NPDC047821]|uniref:hypothetical protein n=1 Tax=Streptomyces sp. NPDC047821 TaxID=3365488 RepID=UPI0037203739
MLGTPIEYARIARATLEDDRLLATTQMCVLRHDRADTADLARTTAASALPNRHALLRGLEYENPGALNDRPVDALVAHGTVEDIAHRAQQHFDAEVDHVSLHLMTTTPDSPPISQGEQRACLPARWHRGR